MFCVGLLFVFLEVASVWLFLVGGEPGVDAFCCEAGLGGAINLLGVNGGGNLLGIGSDVRLPGLFRCLV